MPTNLALDDKLLEEAVRIGGRPTKRETVNEALSEYIERRRRLRALSAFGSVEFDRSFDHKKARKQR